MSKKNWATFSKNFANKNFQKLPNLVTLEYQKDVLY